MLNKCTSKSIMIERSGSSLHAVFFVCCISLDFKEFLSKQYRNELKEERLQWSHITRNNLCKHWKNIKISGPLQVLTIIKCKNWGSMGNWFSLLLHYNSWMSNFKNKNNFKVYKETRKHGLFKVTNKSIENIPKETQTANLLEKAI